MISIPNIKEIASIGDYLVKVPFNVNKKGLYTPAELYKGYDPQKTESFDTCYDTLVYKHFMEHGKNATEMKEALARSLHDFSMSTALDQFLADKEPRRSVVIMGGHALKRTEKLYREIVWISKRLTEDGYLMLSGGGPGAMEATHLGAWLAGRTKEEVNDALDILSYAPTFHDKRWLSTAFRVMADYPQTQYQSLGIPTWLYGHEPSTPFATHIAKFFENSIREDDILTFAFGGIIYTPGSAGTIQEVFQEAVQNHYLSFGYASPMVFMDCKFWTEEMPIYHVLQEMMKTGKYKNLMLSLSDNANDIINTIEEFGSKAI